MTRHLKPLAGSTGGSGTSATSDAVGSAPIMTQLTKGEAQMRELDWHETLTILLAKGNAQMLTLRTREGRRISAEICRDNLINRLARILAAKRSAPAWIGRDLHRLARLIAENS